MEVAEYLRQAILDAFKNSKELPELTSILEYVISGSNTTDFSEHLKRIILSIGQDICRGVSNGKWKLPLASTICNLHRGMKVVTIINRLGHCESYNYIRKLVNIMVMALKNVLPLITSQIVIR